MATAFRLIFQGSQEVLKNNSTASGLGTVIFDDAATTLEYVYTITGLDFGVPFDSGTPQTVGTGDDVTGMHIHNAARGTNGGIVLNLLPSSEDGDFAGAINPDGSTTITGAWDPADASPISINDFATALTNAKIGKDVPLYFNVHTNNFSGGEIRAQFVAIANDQNNVVNGTAGAELLPGLDGNDVIAGKGGNDELQGGEGNDTLNGGQGDDRLEGDDGTDTASYQNDGAVNVSLLLIGSQNTGGAGSDELVSIENLTGSAIGGDDLIGNLNANVLAGLGGNDTLLGEGGLDILLGGNGKDSMTGGADADIFDFNSKIESKKGLNRDEIADFSGSTGELDRIDLRTIDANSEKNGNQAFKFIDGANFTKKAGQLQVIQDAINGVTIVQGDINGDRKADFQIELTGLHDLIAADFLL
jgi:serralysin